MAKIKEVVKAEKGTEDIESMIELARKIGAQVSFRYVGAGEFLTENDEVLLPFGNILIFVFRFGDEVPIEKIEKVI